MIDFPEHLIVQAILAAQARFEDAEKVAAEAARAYVAGLTAFNLSSAMEGPNERFLRKAAEIQAAASVTPTASRSTAAAETP